MIQKSNRPKKIDGKKGRLRGESIEPGFPVVGIGASAGGLEALSDLLRNIPPDLGMAFVIVQHLDPKHESLSSEILARTTQMPVMEIKTGVKVQPDHVYVLPPNCSLKIGGGVLRLATRNRGTAHEMVIDLFFESLAIDEKKRAIAIVLSGTAADGTQGLAAIKAEGGFTCAQDPKSAKFEGMPRSAIASGMVDLVLSPKGLAKELARMSKDPYFQTDFEEFDAAEAEVETRSKSSRSEAESLRRIFVLLRQRTGVDFSSYKYSTIKRRIARRVVLHRIDGIEAYAKFLETRPTEIEHLFNDILINVTGFFRDPKTFSQVKKVVLPKLVKGRKIGQPFRIWVPGCATGEEAYSLAIILLECLGKRASSFPIQIFATDISQHAIQRARAGFYSDMLTNQVGKARLDRFFDRVEGGYKIKKVVRDMCLFSRHDVTSDPPFARLDLVSCRNLLIYFSPALQKRVIPIFHYSIVPNGFLLLGRSEGTAGFASLFGLVDKANRIYRRNNAVGPQASQFPLTSYAQGLPSDSVLGKPFVKLVADFQKDADQLVISEYGPPGVLINGKLEVLQFRGKTRLYLEQASGQPSTNILKLTRSELLSGIRVAIERAKKTNQTASENEISFKFDGKQRLVNIKVIPINSRANVHDRKFLVLFENDPHTKIGGGSALTDKGGRAKVALRLGATSPSKDSARQYVQAIARLEKELHSSLEYQESLAVEFDTTQEELTSVNEELQSTNEEFQSTNEELETAKEELQSANEELSTVNDELQNRNSELTNINNDLTNLLGAVEIPIVMVGNDQRIRRYTPRAAAALNLIPTDVGRPISDIRPNFDIDIGAWVTEVVDSLIMKEVEVKDRQGKWSRVQVRPYRTVDHKIDGAVLSFTDIDFLKVSLKDVQAARAEAEKANFAKDLFLATLSHELRTPLTGILSWAQLLQSGKLDRARTNEAIDRIVECGKVQAQLISDLLDVSRIIMGKIVVVPEELAPADVLRSAIEAIRPAAQLKSVEIAVSVEIEDGKIFADPVRLRQVFWNLLTNAVKFSAPNSRVTVTMNERPKEGALSSSVFVTIADTGKGINAAFLPRLFDNFSQEDSSSIRKHGGLGLGLAIVKNLVELQGGTVQAASEGEGCGSTFTVSFPLVGTSPSVRRNVSEPKSVTSLAKLAEKKQMTGMRVLIVDDEAVAREAISVLLKSLGAETRVAESCKTAMREFVDFKPTLLVSDIGMPVEDGFALIKKVRSLGKKSGGLIPAVAITAYVGPDDVARVIAAGFQGHIAKPFDVNEFAADVLKYAKEAPKKSKR